MASSNIFVLPSIQEIATALPHLQNISVLAQGGQKIVYQATHAAHGSVVLKLIPDPSSDERVQREIELSQQHMFTNVPRVYESGYIAHGGRQILYLIEQCVDGETLRTRLQRDTTLPIAVVLDMLRNLLTTVTELEQQRLVHRDIKPENIMVGVSGEFWLLDFGIARHLDLTSLTATANHFGPHTAGYAAPEQFRNRKLEIDSRADLFSLGVVAHEALSGIQPFWANAQNALEVLHNTERLKVPPLSIPGDSRQELSGFISALMDKSPVWRPKNAQAALDWFVSLLPHLVII